MLIIDSMQISAVDKIVIIQLKNNPSFEEKQFSNVKALDLERPKIVLKFLVNKFQKNLKMSIICEKKEFVFHLEEYDDYYSSIYFDQRICLNDKYLLKVEKNEFDIVGFWWIKNENRNFKLETRKL
uniref:Uncharacterized protein n=2 Tax=Meloidogyne enterolobii TaxID=390850 RepID=A0A6V7XLU9_MELEN|nr:unnamed protein product [Meloidogyne enterolobii]